MTRPVARRTAPRARTAPPVCAQADQLWAYLDAELPAVRARAVARHVATCPGCGATLLRLKVMLEACRAEGCRKLPPEVRARARARVRVLMKRRQATIS